MFQFKNEIRLGDVIAACSFLIAAVGLFLNWWQLRVGGIRKRAEFIVSVFNQYVTDPEAASILYDIEYKRFKYSERFHGSEDERKLDRLLNYYEKIATLFDMRIVTLADLELVKYDFIVAYKNAEVQKYFETLDKHPIDIEGCTFEHFRGAAALLEP